MRRVHTWSSLRRCPVLIFARSFFPWQSPGYARIMQVQWPQMPARGQRRLRLTPRFISLRDAGRYHGRQWKTPSQPTLHAPGQVMCYTFTFLVMWHRHGLLLPCFRVSQRVPYIFAHDKLLLPSIVQVGTLCLWRKALCLIIETKSLVPLMKRWVWTQELKQEFGPVLFPSPSWYVLPVISKPITAKKMPCLAQRLFWKHQ